MKVVKKMNPKSRYWYLPLLPTWNCIRCEWKFLSKARYKYYTEIIKSMNYLRFLVTVPHSCFYFGLEYTGWIFRLVVFTSIYVLWYYIKYVLWFTYHFGCYQNCNKCLSYATDFNLLVFMMLLCFVQVSILHSNIH